MVFHFLSAVFGEAVLRRPMTSEMTGAAWWRGRERLSLQHVLCKTLAEALRTLSFILFSVSVRALVGPGPGSGAAAACAEGPELEGRGVNSISWVRKRVRRSTIEEAHGFWLWAGPRERKPNTNNASALREQLQAWIQMWPWRFWKEDLAAVACKHVYDQPVKALRKAINLHGVVHQTRTTSFSEASVLR